MSDFEPKFIAPHSNESPKVKAQSPITAWIEDMRDPSPQLAAKIDGAYEAEIMKITGKPIRTQDQLRQARAARDARLINKANPLTSS